jgi:hypothetical protein
MKGEVMNSSANEVMERGCHQVRVQLTNKKKRKKNMLSNKVDGVICDDEPMQGR